MDETPTKHSFPDRNQSYWQLTSIQAASLGVRGAFIGGQVAVMYDTGTAILSVVLGNLILWIVGLSIISMAAPGKDNALENIYQYLGKTGAIAAATFLILSFISWYILQLNFTNIAITNLILENNYTLRLGAGLGAFIALLSIGGIVLIRKYCTFILPFLILFVFYSTIVNFSNFHFELKHGLSIIGIVAIISTTLPGIVNLPTFFRHSRSLGDSYLGLSLTIIFAMLFQIFTIISGLSNPAAFDFPPGIYSYLLIGFIILSLVSVNLVNIYYASAGWEMIFPHHKSGKEYVIVGLLGTLAYTFIQISAPMEFILNVAENFIASLGIVLLLSFLTKTFERHRPRAYEKVINFGCWFFGAIVGTIYTWRGHIGSPKTLLVSFCATTLVFLFIIYLEETIWSARKIIEENKHEQ